MMTIPCADCRWYLMSQRRLYVRPDAATVKLVWNASGQGIPHQLTLQRKVHRQGWKGDPNTKDTIMLFSSKVRWSDLYRSAEHMQCVACAHSNGKQELHMPCHCTVTSGIMQACRSCKQGLACRLRVRTCRCTFRFQASWMAATRFGRHCNTCCRQQQSHRRLACNPTQMQCCQSIGLTSSNSRRPNSSSSYHRLVRYQATMSCYGMIIATAFATKREPM